MNYADIKLFDVANGTGVRVSVFVSGCTHHCKNCFNADTWDFGYGKPFTDVEINHIIDSCKEDYIAGLSLLGGEPMEYVNQQGLLPLARKFKETYPDKTIWCYTGYTFETDLLDRMCNEWEYTKELLSYIDVLTMARIFFPFRTEGSVTEIQGLKEPAYHRCTKVLEDRHHSPVG